MAQYPVQFAYDIFIENKGNGPAFNVFVRRLILTNNNKQKMAVRQTSRGKLEQFTKRYKMIGRGEKVQIHREQSDSYEYVRIEVSYKDHFSGFHKTAFEGDRDGLELKEYPIIKDYAGDEKDNLRDY